MTLPVSLGTGFGGKPFGSGPFGDGGVFGPTSVFFLEGAFAIRENVVRLQFSQPVQMSGLLDRFDGTLKTHYAFQEDDTTVGLDGSPARPVMAAYAASGDDATEVDVTLDRPLSPFPTVYDVLVSGLYDASGDLLVGTQSAQFQGLYRGITPPTSDLLVPSSDLANPQSLSGLVGLPEANQITLGTLPADDTGDLATDQGIVSYKKRVYRRLTTPKGAYLHAPDYGVSTYLATKQVGRPGIVQSLAAEAEQQVAQEPETQSVSVTIVNQGSVVYYRIRARTKAGQNMAMTAPVSFSTAPRS